MKLAIGSDHHGIVLKQRLVEDLRTAGHEVVDVGALTSEPPVDYPDIAADVAQRIANGMADRGILICGSGIGMSIAANKVSGVRAAACYDLHAAQMSRRHNDANVLCLSDANVPPETNRSIVQTWMQAEFDGGRHQKRVDKIADLERRHSSK